MMPLHDLPARSSRTTLFCATIIIVLASLTLIGWASGFSVLASVRSNYIPMAPSTALCFLCISTGLVMRKRPSRWTRRLLAIIVLLVAGAKLVEALWGIHFGIDEWLVRDPVAFGSVHTGRMAPITALNFVFIAMGILFLTDPGLEKAAGSLGAFAALVSTIVLIGYLDGTPLLYGGAVIPVALTTALAFLRCSIALLSAAGPQAWPMRVFRDGSTRALLLRSFLPAIVALTLLNGWVRATLFSDSTVNPALFSSVSAIFFALLMTWIISKVSGVVGNRIDAAEAARNRAQTELVTLNTHLEELVNERTRELKSAHEQLIHAERMETVGRMAAGVAHEVKNPLQILIMSLDYLAQQLKDRDNVLDGVLKEMVIAARRADTIIQGLLAFSRSDDLELKAQDLNPLVTHALMFVKHNLNLNHVSLQTQLTPDLPQVALDAQKIEQVLVNLFSNAIDAMPKGGSLCVKTRTDRLTETPRDFGLRVAGGFYAGDVVVRLEIDDTGSGIPPQSLRKIFDPFFTSKATGKGTGLGLAIVKRIIDLHSGHIMIDNRPEGGVHCELMFKPKGVPSQKLDKP